MKSLNSAKLFVAVSLAFFLCEAAGRPSGQNDVSAIIKELQNKEVYERRKAVGELGNWGREAKVVVPALLQALADEESVHKRSVESLVKIGKTAVPFLIKAVETEETRIRERALDVLANLGSQAKEAVPILMKVSGDDLRIIRRKAVEALGAIGDISSIPTLTKRLATDEDAYVRRSAAYALGRFGEEAQPAVPVLMRAINDPESPEMREDRERRALSQPTLHGLFASLGVGDHARRALTNIGLPAVPSVAALLMNSDSRVRLTAIDVLGGMKSNARPATVPLLIKMLHDEDAQLRMFTAIYLGEMGVDARAAIPTLTKGLKDSSADVRRRSAIALRQIDRDNLDGLEFLMRDMKGKDPLVRFKAADALSIIGEAAEPAIPALAEALQDSEASVRGVAMTSILRIGTPSAARAWSAIAKTVTDPNDEVRETAQLALARLQQDEAAIPVLIQALEDKDDNVRILACRGLLLHGVKAKGAVRALTKLLKDSNKEVREQAADALRNIQGLD